MNEQMRDRFGFSIEDASEKIRVLDWVSGGRRPATDTEIALWDALATQPQAPQGGEITDAERYEFMCTIKDEVTMDFLAECIGSRKHLDAFVDELIKERKSAAPTETPEAGK